MQLRTACSEMTYNEEHRLDSSFAFGGSFPIILDGGLIVGMITISGLTPEEDHTIVVNALRTYLNEREVL
ncbi:heme-binding protein [Exiguobacterium sp. TDN 0502]